MAARLLLLLILLLAGLGPGAAVTAHAQQPIRLMEEYNLFSYDKDHLNEAMINGRKPLCSSFDGVIFGKIVNCLTQPGELGTGSVQKAGILVAITNVLIHRMQPFFAGIVIAACTLAIALYGVKLATAGVSNVKGETMVLAFKVAVVLAVTLQIDEFYNMLAQLMHGMSAMTFDALKDSADMCPGFARSMLDGLGFKLGTDLWSEWDCVFGLMFFASTTVGGIGILAAMAALFFTTMGSAILIFIMFAGIAMMLLKIAMMGIQTFLLSFMNMTFLMLLSPIFVLQIFFKARKDSFEKWLTLLMESIITPAVLIAALSIMMAILKKVFIYGFLVSTFGISLDTLASFSASAGRLMGAVIETDVAATTNYSDPSQASTGSMSRDGSALPENLTALCQNDGADHPQWCGPCDGAVPGYCPLSSVTTAQGSLGRGTQLCAGSTTTNPNPERCEPCPGGNSTSWCPKSGDPGMYQEGLGTTGLNEQAVASAAGESDVKKWRYGSILSGVITVVMLMATGAILKRIPEIAGGLASTGVNFAMSPVMGEKFFDRAKVLAEEGVKAYASGGTSAAMKVGEKGMQTLGRDGPGGIAGDIAANIVNQRRRLPR